MNVIRSFLERMAAASAEREQAEAEFRDNYTPRARQVVALAEEEALRLNHCFIGTEHLLLGLVKFGQGVAAIVLKRHRLDSSEIEKLFGPRPGIKIEPPVPFTPQGKRVLARAQKEARLLGHTYVGTEHILLGLLAGEEDVAARSLKGCGLDLLKTRQEILEELDPNFMEGGEAAGI